MAEDLLWNLKNLFYLGDYLAVLDEAPELNISSESQIIEKDFYVYRSYIALGQHELVIMEISDKSAMALIAVKLLAKYLSNPSSHKEAILKMLSEWMQDTITNTSPYICIITAIIYANEKNYVEALKACHSGITLEMMAVCVQIYLQMNRTDKAEQQIKEMSKIDDDATITQLATAWTNIQLGGAKIQEAYYIFQELGEKFNFTSYLHNGSIICKMKMRKFEDAEKELLESLRKDSNNSDILANLITNSLHLNKPITRYKSQLETLAPNHLLEKITSSAEEVFDRAASAYS